MDGQEHQDWQSRKTITECNRHMRANNLACDVTFIVGPGHSRIGAHKYVLASRSCVFYAMFYGPLGMNTTGDEISIPDMTSDHFNSLLDFLYTDDVKLNLNNVLAMLYASKKYCIQSLIDRCLNKLKNSMNPQNVCTVMENAHFFEHNELKDKCYSLIMQDPEAVFDADDLGELCDECFAAVVGDDLLPLQEDKVFEAVMKYGKQKCLLNDIDPTDANVSDKVRNVINKVRFPLLREEYFTDKVEPTKLLTDKQVLQVYRYFVKKQASACPDFNTNRRKSQYTAKRFSDIVSGWGYKRDKTDAIMFSCSSDINIVGVYIYGSDQGPAELDIHVRVKEGLYGVHVVTKRFLMETDGKTKSYKLLFDNPELLRKDELYSIETVIRGSTTYYGSGGQAIVKTGRVKIKFQNSQRSTNNTSLDRGQIPAIVFERAESSEAESMDTGQ